MAKEKVNIKQLALRYVRIYANEFSLGINGTLYCNICNLKVNCARKSTVDMHRSTKLYVSQLGNNKNKVQMVFDNAPDSITRKIILAFAAADIPSYKLENPCIKDMFKCLNAPQITIYKARLQLTKMYEEKVIELLKYFENKNVFIVIDESECKRSKYFNVMGGLISNPKKIYFLNCIYISSCLNSTHVQVCVFDVMEKYNICLNNLKLIISDAASYMIKALRAIRISIPNVIHVQCLAHLIHNCAMKIRGYYKDIDNLIAYVKALTIKNKTITALFQHITSPPSVILTRWSSWLRAVNYYCDNLPEIIRIVENIEENGIQVENAKEAVRSRNLFKNLCEVKNCYGNLVQTLDYFEASYYDIEAGYNVLNSITFGTDPVNIRSYLNNRLSNNDIKIIMNYGNENISPSTYIELKKCPPASISVERSFSMLNKLLAKDRNFKHENIAKYMFFYYNTKVTSGSYEKDFLE